MKTTEEGTKAKSALFVGVIWQLFAETISPFGRISVLRLPDSRSFSLSVAVKRIQLFFSGVVLQCTYTSSHIQSRPTWHNFTELILKLSLSSKRQPPTGWVGWINTSKPSWCLFLKFLSSFQWNLRFCFSSSKFSIQVTLCSSVKFNTSCLSSVTL